MTYMDLGYVTSRILVFSEGYVSASVRNFSISWMRDDRFNEENTLLSFTSQSFRSSRFTSEHFTCPHFTSSRFTGLL